MHNLKRGSNPKKRMFLDNLSKIILEFKNFENLEIKI